MVAFAHIFPLTFVMASLSQWSAKWFFCHFYWTAQHILLWAAWYVTHKEVRKSYCSQSWSSSGTCDLLYYSDTRWCYASTKTHRVTSMQWSPVLSWESYGLHYFAQINKLLMSVELLFVKSSLMWLNSYSWTLHFLFSLILSSRQGSGFFPNNNCNV